MRARGASSTAAATSADGERDHHRGGRGASRRASRVDAPRRRVAGETERRRSRRDRRRRASASAAHGRDRAQDEQRRRADRRGRDHQRRGARAENAAPATARASVRSPSASRTHAPATTAARPARAAIAGSGQSASPPACTPAAWSSCSPDDAIARSTGDADRAARDQVGVDVDQEAHAAAVGRQEPAERVGAPHDALARRLAVALAAAAAPARGATLMRPAAVDGQVGELRRAEHAPHAGHAPQLLLGDGERAPVVEREGVVDLDRDLEQRLLIEARCDLAPARRPRGCRAGAQPNVPAARAADAIAAPTQPDPPPRRHRQSRAEPGAIDLSRASDSYHARAPVQRMKRRGARDGDRALDLRVGEDPASSSSSYSWRRCVFSR